MNTNNTLERAKKFIYENGRLLDRRRFEYHFEGGSSETVITALRSYQNADGGFGNALEPDIRCPQSQTVPTEMALAIMDEVNAFDSQILEGIESYLGEVTLEQGGVPLVLRSVNDYPHAPWWTTETDHLPSVNPTGGIVGLLYKQKVRTEILDSVDFAKNVNYMWQQIENGKPSGFHDGIHWITFLQHTPERKRANTYWPSINEWLRSSGTIELDPQAAGYVHKVLDWAPTPDSYAHKFIADSDLNIHLKALFGQQQEDGGWSISWPPISPATEQEWRGLITVERLKSLRAYEVL